MLNADKVQVFGEDWESSWQRNPPQTTEYGDTAPVQESCEPQVVRNSERT